MGIGSIGSIENNYEIENRLSQLEYGLTVQQDSGGRINAIVTDLDSRLGETITISDQMTSTTLDLSDAIKDLQTDLGEIKEKLETTNGQSSSLFIKVSTIHDAIMFLATNSIHNPVIISNGTSFFTGGWEAIRKLDIPFREFKGIFNISTEKLKNETFSSKKDELDKFFGKLS